MKPTTSPNLVSNLEKLPADTGLLNVQSPSLAFTAGSGNVASYELKCVVSERTAVQLESILSRSLHPDPFAVNAENGQYSIATLSTDTPEWNCFHRVAGYAKRKYRVRRYGAESIVYLERKSRRGSRVCKQRNTVHVNDLNRFSLVLPADLRDVQTHCGVCSDDVLSVDTAWDGHPFHSDLCARRLQPVCLMTYDRRAWFGHSENGTIRWTLDRNLKGCRTKEWTLNEDQSWQAVVGIDQVICEFKFRGAMPVVFKAAIQDLQLSPGGFSKYRHCVSVLYGLRSVREESSAVQTSAAEITSLGGREHA